MMRLHNSHGSRQAQQARRHHALSAYIAELEQRWLAVGERLGSLQSG